MFIVYKLDAKVKQSGKQIKIAYELLMQIRDTDYFINTCKTVFWDTFGYSLH